MTTRIFSVRSNKPPRLFIAAALTLSLFCVQSSFATGEPDTVVTWSEHVAPIVQENCQGCHRPGMIGPMSLLDYDEVRPWAKSIERQVVTRKMPPWSAHPDSRAMKDDLNLTDEEIATIASWVTGGAPEGDPAKLPTPRVFSEYEGGWQLGTPDLVMQPLEPIDVGKEVDDAYVCFHIPFGIDHELWLKAAEFQAGNSEVVHHFILFGETIGMGKKLDEATPEPGWECGQMDASLARADILQMWAPGNTAPLSPPGVGRRIAPGSDFILQIHFHNTTGIDQVDRSQFGLHLAQPDETIDKQLRMQLVSAWQLEIPAGDPNVEHTAEWTAQKKTKTSRSGRAGATCTTAARTSGCGPSAHRPSVRPCSGSRTTTSTGR